MGYNTTQVERIKTVLAIKELKDEGMSNTKISDELKLDIRTVNRHCKYIQDLKVSDLTGEEVAEKRQELYLELCNVEMEAKKLFDLYKTPKPCIACGGEGVVEVGKGEDKTIKRCKACSGLGFSLNTLDANRFLKSWAEIIDKKVALYGLDNIKPSVVMNTQINNSYVAKDKIPASVAETIRKKLIGNHENIMKVKYEEESQEY